MHEFADVEYCNKVVARMRAPEAFKIEMNLSHLRSVARISTSFFRLEHVKDP